MFYFSSRVFAVLAAPFIIGAAVGAASERPGKASHIPQIYEGSMTWACWGDRQQISLVLGYEEQAGKDLIKLKGFEVYAVGARYRVIEIELHIDLMRQRFSLREHIPDDAGGDVAFWGKVHEGHASEDYEVLSSARTTDQPTCAPQIELTAVHPPAARQSAHR